MFAVVPQFLLSYKRGSIQHKFKCPSIPTNSLKSKSGKQHALFLLSVYMIPIIQGESYSQVARLIRRLPSNRPTAMLMIYKLLSCYPILTKMKSSSKNKMALFLFFPFSVVLLFFFSHQQHITDELLYFQNNFWFLFKSYHADQLFFLDHAVYLCVS